MGAADYHLPDDEPLREPINRSWSRLLVCWQRFRAKAAAVDAGAAGTRITRQLWLLPLFSELGYGRLQTRPAVEIDGRRTPISHRWIREHLLIHLLGCNVHLHKATRGVAGAAQGAPHGIVQDLLNRSDDHLWAFLSNGLSLRVLRDHESLTRQAYVEFDLEAIFEGELFAEFAVLWLVCHESRVEAEKPEACWLEHWFAFSRDAGVRALSDLRKGVKQAIEALGEGFLAHPANEALRGRLRARDGLDRQDYYRQLLRLVYRLIFIFVTEDRGALLDKDSSPEAKALYEDWYSTRRIRARSLRHLGGPHDDLWRQIRLVMGKLHDGCPRLGLAGLGSWLWRNTEAIPDLADTALTNAALLKAVRALCRLKVGGLVRATNWKGLAAEELGSVYEALLELQPELHIEAATFVLRVLPGNEKKTSGSYYTPSSLVECLLDSALDPVLEAACRNANPETALLELKVVDPACGSGHFLVAAARRIAIRLARVRCMGEPAPEDVQRALRDVVGRCIYGVDLNPMAVELCKVALWMEAIEGGAPLSFLDGHIRHGNALLGATPKLLKTGVPNDAWKPITGDHRPTAQALKARNSRERRGQGDLYAGYVQEGVRRYDVLAGRAAAVEIAPDDTVAAVLVKAQKLQELEQTGAWRNAKFIADLWCSAFVWPRDAQHQAGAPTHELFRRAQLDPSSCPAATRAEVERLAKQYQFFHWHLTFPHTFRAERGGESEVAGWDGGFDVVLGNPPWERVKLQEKEWFASRSVEITKAPKAAARKRLIAALEHSDPPLWRAWRTALRESDGTTRIVRESGAYPLCGRGDINTYSIFAELNRALMAPSGRVGCIVPTGIATDATTQFYFRAIVRGRQLASLHSFENEEFIFPNVHHAYKFTLLTLTGTTDPVPAADLVFFARKIEHLNDPERHFTLTSEEFRLINPNTLTCPTFRSRRDAELTKAIYRRTPVLIRVGAPDGNPWHVAFKRMLDMANDSSLFRTREQLDAAGWRLAGNVFHKGNARMLPLYEAKMVHHFDHRFGTYEGQTAAQARQGKLPEANAEQHGDAAFVSLPRYWVNANEVEQRLEGRWERGWLLCWRDVCRSVDKRTVIAGVLPRAGVGHTAPVMFPHTTHMRLCAHLSASLSSYPLDFASRQKIGGIHLTYGVLNQLPVLPPVTYTRPCPWSPTTELATWLLPRILELIYTAWDLEPFASDHGYPGPPFRWNEARRFLLRAELDAAFFHLYGISRPDVEYIMETFWVVRNKDMAAHGSYRTKDTILERFDAMQQAITSGQPYQTVLNPPPADPRLAHPPRE